MSGPVFVIAKQRSGTNLLRKSLASTCWFEDRDEIFHFRRDLGVFWLHRALMIARDPELSIPNQENQEKMFESFLSVYANDERAFSLIDVKYNSFHNLNSMFHDHAIRPNILDLIAKKDYPVIHLIRKDWIAGFVSLQVARDRNVFVDKTDGRECNRTINISVSHLINYLKKLELEVRRTRNWFNAEKPIRWIELEFESLIDGKGEFSFTVANQIQQFLKIPLAFEPHVLTKKIISRPYWELVSNFESEVVPALNQSGFGHLLPIQFRTEASDATQQAAQEAA